MALPTYPKRYYASIKDPKIAPFLLTSIYEGDEIGNCAICNAEIKYNSKTMHPVQSLACNFEEAQQLPGVYKPELAVVKPVAPETDDYYVEDTDSNEQSEMIVNKAAPKPARGNCPVCGGPPGRARGYQHKDGCTESSAYKLAAKQKERMSAVGSQCEKCGGPRRGRGYTHQDNCELKSHSKELVGQET